ncbi:MAG: response regulator [Hydrogenophilales bacterium]|nr:response regulator [Hydrogenophilales bacterium]
MARVLLVEDNELSRDMLTRRLEKRGYSIVAAEDGAQGVAAAQQMQPAVILMDMSLPVLDGWSATRRLKSELATRHIPVIGLSSHAMAADRERALAAGCNDYDTKPVDLERLIAKIEQCLAVHAIAS